MNHAAKIRKNVIRVKCFGKNFFVKEQLADTQRRRRIHRDRSRRDRSLDSDGLRCPTGCECCSVKDRKVPFRGYGSRRDRDCGEPIGYDVTSVLQKMSATITTLGSSWIDPVWIGFEMESGTSGSRRQGEVRSKGAFLSERIQTGSILGGRDATMVSLGS